MKYLIIGLFIILSTTAYALVDINALDDKLDAYILTDSILSSRLETKVNIILGILAPIGLGAIALFYSLIRKPLGLPIVFIIASAFIVVTPITDGFCGGMCRTDICRVDDDCGIGCYCNRAGEIFVCQSE